MTVQAFYQQQYKQRVQIVLVDPSRRRIDARLKDRSVVQVSVWETSPFFRWPQDGEWWTINWTNGTWMLGQRMDGPFENDPIENQNPGDIRIHAPGAITVTSGTQGYNLPRQFTETFGNGTDTAFDFKHNLNSLDVHYVVRGVAAPYTTVLEGTGYTVTSRDLNNLNITFTSAPPLNGYVISILG